MRRIVVWFIMAMTIAGFAAAAEKPQLKLSEVRPRIERLVEEISQDAKEHGIGEPNREDKSKLVESIIANMKARGTYDFVE